MRAGLFPGRIRYRSRGYGCKMQAISTAKSTEFSEERILDSQNKMANQNGDPQGRRYF
jgi:hypothetical protein